MYMKSQVNPLDTTSTSSRIRSLSIMVDSYGLFFGSGIKEIGWTFITNIHFSLSMENHQYFYIPTHATPA
mgnify:CR=1 FL=1